MSNPQQPGRAGYGTPAPPSANAIRSPQRPGAVPQRAVIAPQRTGYAPQRTGYAPQTGGIAPQRGGILPQLGAVVPMSSYTNAPTLGQFWRSDLRSTSVGRRPIRWPGLLAFFGGLLALILLIVGLSAASIAIVSAALAFSVVGGFFALVALVAGFGRVLGFFGLLLAIAGNFYVTAPLFGLV